MDSYDDNFYTIHEKNAYLKMFSGIYFGKIKE